MINVEHTTGMMANTYIENADNFLTSAFTNTWKYSGNRYFPFEITNTEIMWKHKLSVSAQPIIQLSGNISLSNVKVLVTSPFVVEILQYSTKEIKRSVNRFPETFPNIYSISSLFIACTKASVKHIPEVGSFPCISCQRGTYTLNNQYLNTSSFQKLARMKKANFTCLDCPVGANCTDCTKFSFSLGFCFSLCH